jgi:hypothetical protein
MTTDAVEGVLDLSTTANSCSDEEPGRPLESDEHMTSSDDELMIDEESGDDSGEPPVKRSRGVVKPIAGPLPSNHIPLSIESAHQFECSSRETRPFKLYPFDSMPPVYSTHVYGTPLLDNAMFSPLTSYFNNKKRRGEKRIAADDKKMKSMPDDRRDNSYWERRRKNNEAAKRSRDSRRQKEEHIAMKAAYLEQENLKLRAQVALLKNETAKLHFMLYNRN